MTFDEDELRDLAAEAGAFLRDRFSLWKESRGIAMTNGETPSKDMCRGGAVALAAILTRLTGWTWVVTGGWESVAAGWEDHVFKSSVPGGMRDASGEWRGHYWAVSEADPDEPDGPVTYVDVAADQFGHPETIVTVEGDPRYRENLCPIGMDFEIGSGALAYGNAWAKEFLLERLHAPIPGRR